MYKFRPTYHMLIIEGGPIPVVVLTTGLGPPQYLSDWIIEK